MTEQARTLQGTAAAVQSNAPSGAAARGRARICPGDEGRLQTLETKTQELRGRPRGRRHIVRWVTIAAPANAP